MVRLETEYLGLKLQNPLIASSSGLTNSVDKVCKLEKDGIGAVVLKSLFEEQIGLSIDNYLANDSGDYPEAMDYVKNYVRSQSIADYLVLIRECKEQTNIPIIASINCHSTGEWMSFAKDIEDAGADAIELNIFQLNASLNSDSAAYEQLHYNIVKQITKVVSIPIAVKLSSYFNNIVGVVDRLKAEGAAGVVLFNKFYQPDIDIDKLELTSSEIFSVPSDLYPTLRWTAFVSGLTKGIDISGSTGVHDWDSVIKLILAGASSVQLCSALYKNGNSILSQFIVCLEEWMVLKGFESIADFKGKLDYKNSEDPSMFERVQFMKYFSSRA